MTDFFYPLCMSDACFLCLYPTRLKVCQQCNVRAHRKCWKQYVQNSPAVMLCPQCRVCIERWGVTTRAMKKQRVTIRNIITSIINFISRLENEMTFTHRHLIAEEMCIFIMGHQGFLHEHPAFAEAIRRKLIEFYYDDHWTDAAPWYITIFDQPMPYLRMFS